MKHTQRVILGSVITLFSLNTWASNLSISGANGWELKALDTKGITAVVIDADQIIVRDFKSADKENIFVTVKKLPRGDSPLKKTLASYRSAVFDASSSRFVTKETLLTNKEATQYVAEFQTDTGGQEMLHSLLLAQLVDQDLYMLLYEQRRETFLKTQDEVRNLFKTIVLKKAASQKSN